jgi:hypothetical protein
MPHDDDRQRCGQVYDALYEFAHQELVGKYIKLKPGKEKEAWSQHHYRLDDLAIRSRKNMFYLASNIRSTDSLFALSF